MPDDKKKSEVCTSTTKKYKVIETPQDTSFIPSLAIVLWLGWQGLVPCMMVFAIIIPSTIFRAIIIGLLTFSLLLPRNFPPKFGKIAGGWIAHNAKKYFGTKLILEDEESYLPYYSHEDKKDNKAIIFAQEPHDVLPFPVIVFNKTLNTLPKIVNDNCGSALMTSAVFNIPVVRQVYSWVGGDPVDKKTFRKKLANAESFVFCPGGVQEVLSMDTANRKPDDIILFLKKRKGFVKMALEYGSPLVPVFVFNLDGTFGYILPRGKFIAWISRTVGFIPLFFWGRYGIPLGVPFPQKITVVFGKPIDLPKLKVDEISSDVVDKYHSLFVEEMEALFHRHKDDHGYSHRNLMIL